MPPEPWFRLSVRVTPRSGRDDITGFRDGTLMVRLRAAPVEGAANEALIALLASQLSLPKRAIALTGGHRSRTKQITVHGLTPEEALRRLGVSPPR